MKASIPAFTITETVVAMVISGLMVTMAAFTWNAFGVQFQQYQNGSEQMIEVEKLRTAFQLDLERSQFCEKQPNGIQLTFGENRKVEYSFGNRVIRSQNEMADTFFFRVSNWQTGYGKEDPLHSGSFFDRIQLTLTYEEVEFPLIFRKEYDAVSKMKIEKQQQMSR